MNMNKLNQYIIEKTKKVNIEICGFTDSSPLGNLREYLYHRKKTNMQTEFEEKDMEKRINPKLAMPNCKSIIVLGISYNTGYNTKGRGTFGIISRSSWGVDYHRVLKDKIEKLIDEMKKDLEFEYKYFVDTGPLIDRELAKKSGIGYYGKNCSIINDEYGSFIFLGYILTDLDLEISKEIENQCGNCDLCIRACPTGALESPYRLNPKRCISYLTQTKDYIPFELRDRMGIKIYGCDTCQLVCPKNKRIKLSSHDEFIPMDTTIDLAQLFSMSNREFKERYGYMAGSWRGKNILKRNGIIALKNMKQKENINLLIPLLKDENPMIREYAEWACKYFFNKDIQ